MCVCVCVCARVCVCFNNRYMQDWIWIYLFFLVSYWLFYLEFSFEDFLLQLGCQENIFVREKALLCSDWLPTMTLEQSHKLLSGDV